MESLIWSIKIHLSEVYQQGSLRIFNVDTTLHWDFIHHELLKSMCIDVSEHMPFWNILLADMIEISQTKTTHKLWWGWPSIV